MIVILRFTTAVLAQHLADDPGGRVAAAVHGGSYLAMGIAFAGLLPYAVATALALVAPPDSRPLRSHRALPRVATAHRDGSLSTHPGFAMPTRPAGTPRATAVTCRRRRGRRAAGLSRRRIR